MNITVLLNPGRAAPYVMLDLSEHFNAMGHNSQLVKVGDLLSLESPPNTKEAFIELSRKVDALNPDVVIGYGAISLLHFKFQDGPLVNVFQTLKVPMAGIYYDSPFQKEVFPSVASMAFSDIYHMFVWDQYYVDELEKLGFKNSHYMPIAANTNRYRKIKEQAREASEFTSDVSFVGSWSPKRDLVLRRLLDFDLKIYGYGWEAASPGLRERFVKTADNITELPFIFNFSKVNVNVTMEQGVSSLNMRVFDVMACEGFLISDYKTDFEKLFDYEKEVVAYKHLDELPELVQYYLDHDDERREKARAARRRVLREHSYKKRAEFIINTLQKMGIGQG
jgi:spore maturation protein CgeB